MKRGSIISIILIALGFVFECLYFVIDFSFFEIKFWLLGIVLIIIGIASLVWQTILSLLEERAAIIGQYKKISIKERNQ